LAAASTRLDTSRLSFGEIVAGVSALVLLIDLWLPWYGVSVKAPRFPGVATGSVSKNFNAWDAFGGRDVLLFIIAILVIAWVLLRMLDTLPAMQLDPGLAAAVLGVIAAVLVLIGILHIPHSGGVSSSLLKLAGIDLSRKFGLFLGFLATLGIAYGGWTAYNERRRGLAPAAAGAGGVLGGPGAVGPGPGAGPVTPASTGPTEPLGTTPPVGTPSSPGPAAGGESGTAPPASAPPVSTPPTSDPGGAPVAGAGPPAVTPPVSTPPPPPPQPSPQNPPADWYPDPHGQARLRWWDGNQWTDQTAN
jgi:hypothetical protein